jgi:hypothetical protein
MPHQLEYTHCFEYTSICGGVVKPVIPVSFSYNDYEFTYPMLVDSGSIAISLPIDLAIDGFDIDITQLKLGSNSLLTGNFNWRKLDNVDIFIDDIKLKGPIYFWQDATSKEMPYGILGREAIFDSLRIGFREYKQKCIYIALEE